jgi:hypothetical protein
MKFKLMMNEKENYINYYQLLIKIVIENNKYFIQNYFYDDLNI